MLVAVVEVNERCDGRKGTTMETVNMLAVFAEQGYNNEQCNRRGWLQPQAQAVRFRPVLADLLVRLSARIDPAVRQRVQPTAAVAGA
jgi:hypothetical protein